ncbi:metallophosphoesterase [Actinosynnema sp. NPDC047251]|uniref:metallophosphoesterase n=1 Tax=Saccharothrix espanaensis TaxID=103731 RepID=UPI0002DA7A3D|nr:metallophosphoesterase [Saccharothrix espanaensis]
MFVVLFTLVMGATHYYVWRRAVRDTTGPGRARRVGTALVVGLFVLLIAGMTLNLGVLAWPGYLWLACAFYLALLFALLEVPRALLHRAARRRSGTPAPAPAGNPGPVGNPGPASNPGLPSDTEPVSAPEPVETSGPAVASEVTTLDPAAGAAPVSGAPGDPGRRLFIARSLAAVSGVAAVGVVGYGATQALGDPVVKRVPVALGKLDPKLSGYRIAVVSDIHLGPLLGRAHTERIVRMINEQQVDLVAIVGDLVDGTVEELGEAAAPLRDLVSTHGSFFVTGNHEYYSGVQPWLAELDRLGVHPLRNERLRVERAGAAFDLAGVNDVTGRGFDDGPDFARALDGRDRSSPVVLLAHQPVQAHEAARHGVDLQLSGHTHGGQMFPFHLAVGLQQPVRSGLATVDGTQVYTSNGVGFWGPPVRVGAPPDITVVELHHNFAGR